MQPTNTQQVWEIRGWGHTAFDEAKRASHKEVPHSVRGFLAVVVLVDDLGWEFLEGAGFFF